MTRSAATYASICFWILLSGYLYGVLAGIVFSQVGFVGYSGIIKAVFNMHFMVTVILCMVVDIVFQFHYKCIF